MDKNSGIFEVKESGVYQITFTGFFVSIRGHMVKFPTRGSMILSQVLSRLVQIFIEEEEMWMKSLEGLLLKQMKMEFSVAVLLLICLLYHFQ